MISGASQPMALAADRLAFADLQVGSRRRATVKFKEGRRANDVSLKMAQSFGRGSTQADVPWWDLKGQLTAAFAWSNASFLFHALAIFSSIYDLFLVGSVA